MFAPASQLPHPVSIATGHSTIEASTGTGEGEREASLMNTLSDKGEMMPLPRWMEKMLTVRRSAGARRMMINQRLFAIYAATGGTLVWKKKTVG